MAYVASNPRLGIVDLSSVVVPPNPGVPGISALPAVTLEPQLGEVVTGWDPNLGGGEFAYFKVAATVVAAQTISSITISGTTATVTTGSAHGLTLGSNSVTITGAAPSGYNVTNATVVTVPSSTTFTYSIPTNTPTISATSVGAYTVGLGAGAVCELAYSLAAGYLTITATPWTGTTVQGKPLSVALNNMGAGTYGWFQIEGATITVVNGTITVGNPVYWQSNGTLSNTGVASKQMVNATAASLVSSVIGQGNAAVTLPAYQALVFVDRPFAQGAIT